MSRKGMKHSPEALARRPKRAPYDHRWWTRGSRPGYLALVLSTAEHTMVVDPNMNFSDAARYAFALIARTEEGSVVAADYLMDHNQKPLTAKIVECRLRVKRDKRIAEAIKKIDALVLSSEQSDVNVLKVTAADDMAVAADRPKAIDGAATDGPRVLVDRAAEVQGGQ